MAAPLTAEQALARFEERWGHAPRAKSRREDTKLLKKAIKIALKRTFHGAPPAKAGLARVQAFVRKSPQVMVKISGGGKGLLRVMAHMNYISRNGELPLEDQDGQRHQGGQGLRDVQDAWGLGHPPMPEVSQYREAINVVLSMPPGTDRDAVRRAVRKFAHEQFGDNHDYVFACHNDEAHPHVHLCVKARGHDGRRVERRKEDLQAWRERFAEKMREQGVECTATRRRTQLKDREGRAQSQAVQRIKARGETPRREATARTQPRAAERALKNRGEVLRDYRELADALARSPDPAHRKLAIELVQRLKEATKPEQQAYKAQSSMERQAPPQPMPEIKDVPRERG